MDNINKAAAFGVIFFMVILAGFVGIKVDQTTIALLGGAFIGLVIAIPTTVLIIAIGMRRPNEGQVQAPPQPVAHPVYQLPPLDVNVNIRVEQVWLKPPEPNEIGRGVVVIELDNPESYEWWHLRDIASRMTGRTPTDAGSLMKFGLIRFVSPKQIAGEMRCLPAGR